MPKQVTNLLYLLSILIVLCIIRVAQELIQGFPDNDLQIGSIADIVTAITAICACAYSAYEYNRYKERDMMDAFAHYSERYAKDENIKAVSKYLIAYFEGKELPAMPSIYEKEMFFRFFEEIEYQIEKERLSEDVVGDFFVYYGIAAAMCKPLLEDTELAEKSYRVDVWSGYRRLIKRYQDDMVEGIQDDYKKHHPNAPTIEILIRIK